MIRKKNIVANHSVLSQPAQIVNYICGYLNIAYATQVFLIK